VYVLPGASRKQSPPVSGNGAGIPSTLSQQLPRSVFLSTVTDLLGDYATTAPISTFLASKNEQHPTDLAGLRGARLVTAVETEAGRRWAESKIQNLTGGDRISARFMRQDFFQFSPQFKLVIAGNHKPGLRNVDEAIRRRLHLIPFTVTIPPEGRDKRLAEKLREEWPGIMDWALTGLQEWLQQGLNPPPAVLDATADYLAAEDRLSIWIADRCHVGPQRSATAGELFESWREWCESAGEHPGSQKAFSQDLEAKGFHRDKGGKGVRIFLGLTPRDGL